jgi:chromosome segregation ATPase
MRTKSHIRDLEDRMARIEATISAYQLPSQATLASEQLEPLLRKVEAAISAGHSEEMSELNDMRNQLNRQLAFQNDRIASLALKLDRLECQPSSLQSEMLAKPRGSDRHQAATAPLS